MAQFDLKQADLYITDGYNATGIVGTAGAAIGASTVPITNAGFLDSAGNIVVVAVGDTLTFGTDVTIYKVTAHTETSGKTTSIVVTPALVVAVVSTDVGTLQPHSLKVKIGDGNLTYSEKKPRTYVRDRGKLDTIRNGDEEPVDVKLDFQWEYLTNNGVSGAVPTPEDALKKRGPASTWITSGPVCEPYSVDLKIVYTPLCSTDKKEIIILPLFRYEDLSQDLKQGQIAVTGKCNVQEASVSRVA